MFVADTLTIWVEALNALFDNNPFEEIEDLPVNLDYPTSEVDYPGIWLNFTMQGDVKNVGIGHVEYDEDDEGIHEVFRWHFGGLVEITIGAMGNLERARLLDRITTDIAVARMDENREGILREKVERNDLIGMTVTWESMTISGFASEPGTPWGTDDVIYEATVTLMVEGEVRLDPSTGALVPLSKVIITPQREDEGPPLPVPGNDGWR